MAEVRNQVNQVHDDRSLGELFNELSRETSTLVRQEVRLAKVELSQTGAAVGRNLAAIAAGALVLYAGFLALMFSLIYALSETMAPWLAALAVGLIVGAVGAFLAYRGYNQLKSMNMVPERTIESMEENAEWLKQQVQ
jgi:uncharacterized membrane protein YqjE